MSKTVRVFKQEKNLIVAFAIVLLFSLGGDSAVRWIAMPLLTALALYACSSHLLKSFIFFVWTSFVLSLVSSPIMDNEQYLKLAGLSLLYSLGYTLLCSWQRYVKIALAFVAIMPFSLYLNKHYGLDWQYFVGSCFAIGYLLSGKDKYRVLQ